MALSAGKDVVLVQAVREGVAPGLILARILQAIEQAQRWPVEDAASIGIEHDARLQLPGVARVAVAYLEAARVGQTVRVGEDRIEVLPIEVAVV